MSLLTMLPHVLDAAGRLATTLDAHPIGGRLTVLLAVLAVAGMLASRRR